MFPCLRTHATFIADAKSASETQKNFLNFFRNILRPQQMFPRLLATETMLTRFVACLARELFLGLRGKEAKHLFCFPLVCSPWKHYEQQCFRNNVSSFAGAFMLRVRTGRA